LAEEGRDVLAVAMTAQHTAESLARMMLAGPPALTEENAQMDSGRLTG
jgi:hypothetical protein